MASNRNGIPTERAPLLLVFGALAPRVAGLFRARPSLVARLVVAPREAIHSVGAYLHLAPGAARPDAEVAATIENSDPRDLLRAALPGCPPRLYRALDRARDGVRERRYYERLGSLARGPFGPALLGGGALDDTRLAFFEALAAMDPIVAGLLGALPECSNAADALDSVAAYLRSRGAIAERDLRLPPKVGMAAVVRRLQRAIDALRAPAPGFAPPPPLRLVETVGDLRRIGERLGNCVRSARHYGTSTWFDLAEGRLVLLAGDDPPLLAAFRKVGAGVWRLEQAAGPRNAALPPGVREGMLDSLRAAGVRVVPRDPAGAFETLVGYADRPGAETDDADLGDVWDELAA